MLALSGMAVVNLLVPLVASLRSRRLTLIEPVELEAIYKDHLLRATATVAITPPGAAIFDYRDASCVVRFARVPVPLAWESGPDDHSRLANVYTYTFEGRTQMVPAEGADADVRVRIRMTDGAQLKWRRTNRVG